MIARPHLGICKLGGTLLVMPSAPHPGAQDLSEHLQGSPAHTLGLAFPRCKIEVKSFTAPSLHPPVCLQTNAHHCPSAASSWGPRHVQQS